MFLILYTEAQKRRLCIVNFKYSFLINKNADSSLKQLSYGFSIDKEHKRDQFVCVNVCVYLCLENFGFFAQQGWVIFGQVVFHEKRYTNTHVTSQTETQEKDVD